MRRRRARLSEEDLKRAYRSKDEWPRGLPDDAADFVAEGG
jgi:hypothetical protein